MVKRKWFYYIEKEEQNKNNVEKTLKIWIFRVKLFDKILKN